MRCLDTNVVIAAMNVRPALVRDRLNEAIGRGDRLALSTIVIFELRYGVARSVHRDRNAERLDRFLTLDLAILPFEGEDAAVAGAIRADLDAKGTPIGHYDLLIAAQARRHGAMLVTANRREFLRVPGLTIEDWSV